MASRRLLTSLTRHTCSLSIPSLHPLKSLTPHIPSLQHLTHIFPSNLDPQSSTYRNFSSDPKNPKFVDQHEATEEEDDDFDDDEDEYEDETSEDDGDDTVTSSVNRAYSIEDKIQEAADIGYQVIGPLKPDDRVFKPYEPVFAVVQVGSHQFKVSNEDCIYVEKLKHCDVNDKLILNKVLIVGSPTQTIIGRPILPDAAVHAVVEEHALDAKVIIFKKKRRKNYRRTKGHRQELTRLRITDIQGIEKPETPSVRKPLKTEKVAVAA